MSDPEIDSLLQSLEESRLLDGETLAQLTQWLQASPDTTPEAVLRRLAREGRLTEWQAKRLLEGPTAFFFGQYKLVDELGVGATGVVYRAVADHFSRHVAIKTIRTLPEPVKQRVRSRFKQEIAAISQLRHPNIVSFYDAHMEEEPWYLVMECIEGHSLDSIVKTKDKIPVDDVCEYCRQVAVGLEHARLRGIIHRDIKPANIMIDEGATPTVLAKIVDFGLAQLRDMTGVTKEGHGLGTPDFVAPEQADDATSADTRSDIYSLGRTIAWGLTGNSCASVDLEEHLAHCRPDVPHDLVKVLKKMLALQPEHRYDTPAAVALQLSRFASGAEHKLVVKRSREPLMTPRAHFHYGPVVPPEYFIDRRNELERARELICAERGFLIVGRPRTGKTSFCRKLIHDVVSGAGNAMLATHCDLQMCSHLNTETFLEHTILSISGDIARCVFGCKFTELMMPDPTTVHPELAGNTLFDEFQNIFQLIYDHTHTRVAADNSPGTREFMRHEFVRITQELLDVCKATGYHNLVIFYDEANRLTDTDQLSTDMSVTLLTGIEDRLREAGVIGVYAASPEMVQFSEFRNLFSDEVHLGPFQDREDMMRLLSRYYFGDESRFNDLPVATDALEKLWGVTGGSPYRIQMVADRVFRNANKVHAEEVLIGHVEDAFSELQQMWPTRFPKEETQ